MRLTFSITVTPRAGVDAVDGVTADGTLHVRVRAAPADGAANSAVVKALAKTLGIAPSRLQLVSGASSRHKRIATDLEPDAIERLWPGLLTRPA